MIGDFLQQLVKIIQWCWPFEIIRANEQGVRKTFGKIQGPLKPDWYWRVPWAQEMERESTLLDSLDLHIKSLTSSDGKPVSLEVTIWFVVFDAYKLWMTVVDIQENLARLAAGHVNVKVRRRTWLSLRTNQRALEQAVAIYCGKYAAEWGVEIPEVQITQITSAKPYRFLGGIN